jgi:hypothetical protein
MVHRNVMTGTAPLSSCCSGRGLVVALPQLAVRCV